MTKQDRDAGPATSMNIEVRSRTQGHAELRFWAKALVATAFHRFGNHIQKVVVRFKDVNGPKGGIDKDVVISLKLRGGGTKMIRQRGSSYRVALAEALKRAKQVMQRSRTMGGKRPNRFRPLQEVA